MQSIEEKNRQYRRLMMDKNYPETTQYYLNVKTKERPEGFQAITSTEYEYLRDRGEEWLRMNFINEYEVTDG